MAQGKRCLVSGAGNVATFCAELLLEKGATVLTLSDSQVRAAVCRSVRACVRACSNAVALTITPPTNAAALSFNHHPQGYIYAEKGLTKAQLERVRGGT